MQKNQMYEAMLITFAQCPKIISNILQPKATLLVLHLQGKLCMLHHRNCILALKCGRNRLRHLRHYATLGAQQLLLLKAMPVLSSSIALRHKVTLLHSLYIHA